MAAMTLLGLGGSPNPGGRSSTALAAFLDATGTPTTVIELGASPDPEDVQQAIEAADGIVVATPTYRARSSGLVKALLENTQRGAAGERRAPLRGKATAILHTGNAAEHFLAVDDLRSVLAGFFAAQVLAPGLFLHGAHFTDDGDLTTGARDLVAAHGRAFAEFTTAIRGCPAVVGLAPLL